MIYCEAGSTHLSGEHIAQVTLGRQDIISVKGEEGYENYTDQAIDIEIGTGLPLKVRNNSPHSTNELLIWADWNIDGDFEDLEENVYASGPLGITTYQTTLTPPSFAEPGITRLRIRLHDQLFGPNGTSCGDSNLGEVEDYAINVLEKTTRSQQPEHESKSLIAYPNPSTGQLTISLPHNDSQVKFRIINMLGVIVYEGNMYDKTFVNTTLFSPGTYFIVMMMHPDVKSMRFMVE